MLRALGKGFAVAGVATVAWLLFSIEGFVYSLWALDSTCDTACETNLFAAFLVSGLIGLEALVGTATAGVLLAVRKVRAARITVYLLIAALALQHVWLLV